VISPGFTATAARMIDAPRGADAVVFSSVSCVIRDALLLRASPGGLLDLSTDPGSAVESSPAYEGVG
jgi:hypothetical protein